MPRKSIIQCLRPYCLQLCLQPLRALTRFELIYAVCAAHCPQLLPGGDRARYELLAELGELLLAGEQGGAALTALPAVCFCAHGGNQKAEHAHLCAGACQRLLACVNW